MKCIVAIAIPIPVTGKKLDHEEVKAAADARKEDFVKLVKALIGKYIGRKFYTDFNTGLTVN